MDHPGPTLSGDPSEKDHIGSAEKRSLTGQESLVWAEFAKADNAESFCHSWLAVQCRMIADVIGGLVLLGPPDIGPFTPIAVWPHMRRSMEHLTGAAERALKERRGLLLSGQVQAKSPNASPSHHIAYPLESDKKLYGVVVLDVASRPEPQLQAILRQLHWGGAWLEVLFRRQQSEQDAHTQKRLMTVLDLFAIAIEENKFHATALALVTEIATRLSCHRVSVGFVRKNYTSVAAISHTAQFEKKTSVVRAIGSAMDESFDQQSTIIYPPPDDNDVPQIHRTHEELARLHGSAAICTVPLTHCGEIVGALTLERQTENPFDVQTVELCEAIGSVVGPVLEAKRKDDRPLVYKIGESFRNQIIKLTGPRYIGRKLVVVTVVAASLFFAFAKGDYRVSADAVIEGQIQRVIAAPFASYIAEAKARAGDIVETNQILATLDSRDLKLEQLKTIGRREQLLRQHREAMAAHDRSQAKIAMAQLSQVKSQLELLSYQISRTQVIAPFGGILVSGDLSQSLGGPVDKGQVLFEIAPLDAYRVILQVDERDITDVTEGQRGQLALSSILNERLEFVVEKTMPVAVAEEGRNYFRVEARLDNTSERLRPGMEGIGKIYVERRNLLWIWTHRLIDWMRLWIWSWSP